MRINQAIFNLTATAAIAATIFVIGCKKDSSSSSTGGSNTGATTMSTNGTTADGAFGDAFNIAVQGGSDNNLNSLIEMNSGKSANSVHSVSGMNSYYCAAYTLKTTAGSAFPDTLIVDFGSGCSSSGDNITRSGSITYIFSGRLRTPGTTITATFSDYRVAGYKLDGTYTLQNTSSGATASLTSAVADGSTVTYPDDSVYGFHGTKTLTLNLPVDTTNWLNNTLNITGGYTVTNSSGASLVATVTTPLVRQLSCRYIVSGVLGFVYTSSSTTVDGSLNYGDGTCDNVASLTVGSTTKNITLPF